MKIYLFFLFSISCLFSIAQSSCSQLYPYFSGFCSTYYENDSLEWIKYYENGKPSGIWMKFDGKGNLVRQLNSSIKMDSIVKADSLAVKARGTLEVIAPFDELMHFQLSKQEDIIEGFIDDGAEFPGGFAAMNRFVVENAKYPEVSLEMGDQGKVYIECIVEKDGSLSEIRVVKGVSEELDKEALRVVKLMPKWIPEKLNGKPCRARTRFPIIFSLR